MNREIGFRIWSNGFMEEVGSITFHADGSYHVNDEYPVNDVKMQTKYGGDIYFLMEYTGLKDKNGRKIFEGDILRMTIPISINGTRIHNVEVFSQGYAFWFKTIIYPGYTDCLWFHYNASQREVIGNIYQHPELTCAPQS